MIGRKKMANEKILVVDDDDETLEIAKKILKHEGYEVSTATNGSEAIEFINTNKNNLPNLLLLDLSMPEKDGFEVCEYLRQNSILNNLKIIIFTGTIFDESRERAKKFGIDTYITKPFSGVELVSIIKKKLSA